MKKISLPAIILALAVWGMIPASASAGTPPPPPKVFKLLVLPVKFAYNTTSPDPIDLYNTYTLTPEITNDNMTKMRSFVEANSYGKVTISFDISPTLTHPAVTPVDLSKLTIYPYGVAGVVDWAIKTAGSNGFNIQSYDKIAVAVSWAKGVGVSGLTIYDQASGKYGFYINGKWESVIWTHEFGHNLGMAHAGFWQTYNGDIIGNGFSVTNGYGNPFDTMGNVNQASQFDPDPLINSKTYFNIFNKRSAGWLTEGDLAGNQASIGKKIPGAESIDVGSTIQSVGKNQSGLYRIYAMDSPSLPPGPVGLKVGGSATDYWVEFRQLITIYPRLTNGVTINRTNFYNGKTAPDGYMYLLDFTPETPGAAVTYPYTVNFSGKVDCPLLIGQTFSDMGNDIHVTPIQKNGTIPESIDIMVYRNTQAKNSPPTGSLSASALSVPVNSQVTLTMGVSDRDSGERFAYYWQFKNADGTPNTTKIAANAHQISTSWSTPGTYQVTCTASDMKGGKVTKTVSITVN